MSIFDDLLDGVDREPTKPLISFAGCQEANYRMGRKVASNRLERQLTMPERVINRDNKRRRIQFGAGDYKRG